MLWSLIIDGPGLVDMHWGNSTNIDAPKAMTKSFKEIYNVDPPKCPKVFSFRQVLTTALGGLGLTMWTRWALSSNPPASAT